MKIPVKMLNIERAWARKRMQEWCIFLNWSKSPNVFLARMCFHFLSWNIRFRTFFGLFAQPDFYFRIDVFLFLYLSSSFDDVYLLSIFKHILMTMQMYHIYVIQYSCWCVTFASLTINNLHLCKNIQEYVEFCRQFELTTCVTNGR